MAFRMLTDSLLYYRLNLDHNNRMFNSCLRNCLIFASNQLSHYCSSHVFNSRKSNNVAQNKIRENCTNSLSVILSLIIDVVREA